MLSKIYHYLDKKYNSKHFLLSYRLFKLLINFFYPIFVFFSKRNELDEKSDIIVSLTSFPARISKVYIVIETLLRQTVMPNKIILYLSLDQFSGIEDIPKKLRKLCYKNLLIVKFVKEDYKPHKKYYYSINDYDKNILTVDDDMFYPEDLIEILANSLDKYPNTINCILAKKIGIKGSKIDLYKNWSSKNINPNIPRFNLIPIGCGGVLYPYNCFNKKVLLDQKMFMRICPQADDLWLKFNSTINNKKSVKAGGYYNFVFIDIIIKNNKSLWKSNVNNKENDIQLNDLLKEFPMFVDILNTEKI